MTRHWPLAVALAIYLGATGVLLHAAMHLTDGYIVYVLDDAYIHMAMAKNIALHHVWGVTRAGFASSTSSPLWTLLLATTYGLLGVHRIVPLVFNVLAGSLLVVGVDRLLRRRAGGSLLTLGVLLGVIFVTPLPTLTLMGMEHTLHALMTLWLVIAAAALLAADASVSTGATAMVGLLAALTTGVRYEGVLAVGVVTLLLVVRRRVRQAVIIGAMGATPVVGYGLWSLWNGWYFLPNSVLLKGQAPPPTASGVLAFFVGLPALRALLANPHILVLVAVALSMLLWVVATSGWSEEAFLLAIFTGTALLHLQVARVGWFYRYEAYLVLLGIAIIGFVAAGQVSALRKLARGPRGLPVLAVSALLIAVLGVPFASRAVNAWRNTPIASSNIYSQQYQIGRFLDRFYQGEAVAMNDIGAVSYLADIKLFDLYGLADRDVVAWKRIGTYSAGAIEAGATQRGVVIAVISPTWLNDYGGVPANWTKVGQWGVRDNVVLGESAVSFYAVTHDERGRLTDSLRSFAPELPPSVIQAGAYTQ